MQMIPHQADERVDEHFKGLQYIREAGVAAGTRLVHAGGQLARQASRRVVPYAAVLDAPHGVRVDAENRHRERCAGAWAAVATWSGHRDRAVEAARARLAAAVE